VLFDVDTELAQALQGCQAIAGGEKVCDMAISLSQGA
jgi:hypothetical protein